MNKKTAIYLSVASLLILVIIVILAIRRRGRKAEEGQQSNGSGLSSLFRKKVFVKDPYRLNNNYTIWVVDNPEESLDTDTFFNGSLEYVYVPAGASSVTDSAGYSWYPITGVGYVVNGQRGKTVYKSNRYIESKYLSL